MKVLETICQSIFDKKGFNILTLDVRAISSMTNYCIIAEGNVEKHVQTIARVICQTLADCGIRPIQVEGQQSGDWVVVDFADVMVHLFIPDMREKYALEELMQKAQVVDVPIKLGTEK